MKKIARIGIATALLVAGCGLNIQKDDDPYPDQTPRDSPPTGTALCKKQGTDICIVTLTVNSCTNITADVPEAWVPPADVGDVVFRLGGNWKFDAQGVTWRNHHSDFTNPRGFGTREFRWHNAHTVKNKKHKYTAFVTDGSQHCKYDPSIMN